MSAIIRIDNIDGTLVIVLVAFLAIPYRDVPTQAVMEDSRSQPEHLFEQISMLFGIMRLNDHNHDEDCLLDLRCSRTIGEHVSLAIAARRFQAC
jgi:hypothetical protein